MKRTISVNIKGTNFIIEEDGYELLKSYLQRLENLLQKEEGSKEIVEDIEYRIAELFNEKISARKSVIELDDVESILKTLGNPEDYVDEKEVNVAEEKTEEQPEEKGSRRLFRDVENGKIAGVCSGLAAYFGIDVIIVRILFLIVFFFGAFSIPIYIILWALTPKAKTNIDRLRMHGKSINIDSVKNEVNASAERIKTESQNFAQRIRQDETVNTRIKNIFKIIGIAIGIMFLISAISLFISIITFGFFDLAFIPADTINGKISLSTLQNLLIETPKEIYWMRTSMYTIGFSVVILLVLISLRLLLSIKGKWYNYLISAFFVLTIGFIVVVSSIGFNAGINIKTEGEIEKTIGMVQAEQLIINSKTFNRVIGDNYRVKSYDFDLDVFGVTILPSKIVDNGINISYVESEDSLFHIYKRLTANGASQQQAVLKAKNIKCDIQLNGNVLTIPTTYSYPKKDKLRDQEVTVIIAIPKGKTIKINDETISLNQLTELEDEDFMDDEQEGYLDGDGEYSHGY